MAQRRGLFGGFNPLRFSGQPNDNLMRIGAALSSAGNGGDPSAMLAVGQMIGDRQKAQQREQALQRLNNGLFGGGQPATPQLDLEALATGQTPADPMAAQPQRQGLPSLREAAPALIAAQQAGLPVADYISLLDKAGPDVKYERGFRYDSRDPNSAPAYAPNLGEGEEPVYDARGNVVGTRNLSGAVRALGERTRAVADANNASEASYAGAITGAQEQARAPWAVERVVGPNGETITTSRANVLGSGGMVGISPAEQVYQVDTARNLAANEQAAETRASSAERMLPTFDRMEALLPDIIAGFGSGPRRTGARVLGALGNEEAQRQAAATEVFENEARQIVANIVRTFGANPTEGERKYAEQMSGADVNITPQALAEGIRLGRARAERDIAGRRGGQQQGGDRAARARAELQRRGLL